MLLGGKRMKMAFGLTPLVSGALARSHFSREDVGMNSLGMGQTEGVLRSGRVLVHGGQEAHWTGRQRVAYLGHAKVGRWGDKWAGTSKGQEVVVRK